MQKLLHIGLSAFFLLAITLAGDGFIQAWAKLPAAALELRDQFTADSKIRDYQPIEIVAFGDLMLGRYVWTLMQQNGHDYPLEFFPELLEEMNPNPDFLMANLEGPISEANYINPGTAMVFNFRPEVIETLQKYGFNLLGLANNHAYDMGQYGVDQTRTRLAEDGIHYFGDAQQIRTETTWVTTIHDTSLAFVGFNDTVQDYLDYSAANNLITELESEADFTIVSIHWGSEYRETPTEDQIQQAHDFIDAGADVILGHHPHVIEDYEWYDGKPIYYSLGNFVFDQYFQANVQEGLGVTLTLQKFPDGTKTIQTKETVFDIISSQVKLR
jgi:gamma-polyglutamate biosynthesis protein CapA